MKGSITGSAIGTSRSIGYLGRCTVLMALVLVAACAGPAGGPPPAEEGGPAVVDDYQVGIGDTLAVNVWKNPEFSVTVPVRPDGRISLPLVGDIAVGGRAPEAIAATIEEEVAAYVRDPQVTVIVTSVGSAEYVSRVRVTGAVQQPRSLPYRSGMTVMDVVLEAGGTTEFANANGARLYRPGEEARPVRLGAILERGDLRTNYRLQPGDVITVPETAF